MDTSHVDVSIPRNTEVDNGIITHIIVRLPTDLPFEDFIGRVCANMDLNPTTAIIGYKFAGDRISDNPMQLVNADELTQAMAHAIDKINEPGHVRLFLKFITWQVALFIIYFGFC